MPAEALIAGVLRFFQRVERDFPTTAGMDLTEWRARRHPDHPDYLFPELLDKGGPGGWPRDELFADLAAGRPTVSPDADELIRRVTSLMDGSEAEALYRELDISARRSAGFQAWALDPTHYLAHFDVETPREIEKRLRDLLVGLRNRARARGWEVPDEPSNAE